MHPNFDPAFIFSLAGLASANEMHETDVLEGSDGLVDSVSGGLVPEAHRQRADEDDGRGGGQFGDCAFHDRSPDQALLLSACCFEVVLLGVEDRCQQALTQGRAGGELKLVFDASLYILCRFHSLTSPLSPARSLFSP